MAEIGHRLLHVLSFCNQERLFLFIFKIEVSVVLQTTWKYYQLIKYLELVCQLWPGTFEKLWMDITKFCCQPFCFSCANHGFLMVSSPWSCSLGSLSNDYGDGNENGKKQQLCTCITLFCTFLSRRCRCNVKVPNFTFCRGREHKATTFFLFSWTLILSCRIQLQKIANICTN